MLQVYAMNIKECKDDRLLENLCRIISAERIEQVRRLQNQADRQRGIIAEALLRYALYKHYNLKEEIRFGYNAYGKPFLKGNENIFFNISHSGAWVLCGVGSISLGVDVEKITKTDLKIAQRFFDKTEYSYLLGLDSEQQNEEFYKVWTLKESYVKEVGMGLSMPLNSFSFALSEEKILLYEQNCIRKDLQFYVGKMDDTHCYAICIKDDEEQRFENVIRIVTRQELQEFGEMFTVHP